MQVKSIAEFSKDNIPQTIFTFIKLHFVIKIFVLSIFELQFYIDLTVHGIFYMCRHIELYHFKNPRRQFFPLKEFEEGKILKFSALPEDAIGLSAVCDCGIS